jgi:2-dehydro-3-deoxygluconokinase
MTVGPAVAVGSVVTMGETMALLDAPASGRLGPGAALPLGLGGAESNVAIGLARLGVGCTWVSRVGDDALGAFLTREIRAEGVRVVATRDPGAPTGLMIKELRGGRPSRVRYYRRGSAASRLAPADVDEPDVAAAIVSATVLHLTGITAALGPAPLAAVEHRCWAGSPPRRTWSSPDRRRPHSCWAAHPLRRSPSTPAKCWPAGCWPAVRPPP